jgi:hypothetical protein
VPGGAALDIRTTSKIRATESRKRKSKGRDRAIIRMIGDMIAKLPDRRLSFMVPILPGPPGPVNRPHLQIDIELIAGLA